MSDVLIVCPLGIEAQAVRSARPGMRVRMTGMGPRRALRAAPGISADPAGALIVLGFGGGLSAGARLCEVVVADEVLTVDGLGRVTGEPVACEPAEPLARALSARGLPVARGGVASAEEIVTGDGRARMERSGARAVDMESAWVADGARGRPFAVVRVILDTPERELEHRLPVGPPLPTLGDGLRAIWMLRRVAAALGQLKRQGDLHTVLGMAVGERSD